MQFVVRVDIEDAVVRILTDHAMQLLPLALLLKLLRVRFLASLYFIGSGSGHVVGQMYVHSYEIKHRSLNQKVGVSQVHRHNNWNGSMLLVPG
ncbi:hypothetical protein SBC1_76500 (plasmid) [Caballeronia sp. SBC1]|nr:hypothetical protein SBC2_79680 [Caballeronia sp. SBC2]QIN67603.1 hypothetical protein SBC1_76500 [Caballeronia sp. SBC1]